MINQEVLFCPVCRTQSWRTIGTRRYERNAVESATEQKRRRLLILFNHWFPGVEQVNLESLACGRCGFVTYAPRPGASDLDRKYEFLNSLPSCGPNLAPDDPIEERRSLRIWKKMKGNLPSGGRILDYGGNDGRLMKVFNDHSFRCFVVDYNERVVEGVQHLSHQVQCMPQCEAFDGIICSHVLEHVADPRGVLESLQSHLAETGVIYVEVPMEVWRKAPLKDEPVTHVNFFTVDSMRTLLLLTGYNPQFVRMEGYDHPLGYKAIVISALATKAVSSPSSISWPGVNPTLELLNPSLFSYFRRAFLKICPAMLYGGFVRLVTGGFNGHRAR